MAGSFGRGLDFLKGQQEASSYKQRMPKLWLKAGESARLWFVQDHDEIAVPLVHMVSRKKRNGDLYTIDVLCGRLAKTEDHSVCSLCVVQEEQYSAPKDSIPPIDVIKGPWPRAVALVWVEYILHPFNNDDGSWKVVKAAGSSDTYYREDVKNYQLLIMREKITEQIAGFLGGDPMSDKPAPTTLLDRHWRFKVTGEKASKLELLVPEENAAASIPAEVTEARAKAPDFDTVLISEFGDSPRIKADTYASGSGHTAATGEAVELVDYFPDEDSSSEDEIEF